MTEHPILFSGPLVRAIIEGRKTQTRRVVQPQPPPDTNSWTYIASSTDRSRSGRFVPRRALDLGSVPAHLVGEALRLAETGPPVACRYNADRLWVRERMRVIATSQKLNGSRPDSIRVRYEADGVESGPLPYPERLNGVPVIGKCLSYGGYREASRLSLGVTEIRVERLQAITEEDAQAEGVCPRADLPSRVAFADLWNRINGKRPGCSWEANPWAWVVSFKRLEKTDD